ncbi:ribonuclease III [bacterium AH-315-C07]|nr:ribonuclease III [bacterium AH-315-C07]
MILILSSIKGLFLSNTDFSKHLKTILSFTPGNPALYESAFRHKSASVEIQNGIRNSNERLEFLGDAILDSIIAEFLFKHYPFKDEGFLTEMRAKIVNRQMLGELALKLGIDSLITVDSKDTSVRNQFKSINGDALEALIGAIYLDKGFKFTKKYVLKTLVLPYINVEELESTETNFKSKILEWSQKEGKLISFEMLEELGSGHSKQYKMQLLIDDEPFGLGLDHTKKKAEQAAAQAACEKLKLNNPES